MTNQCSNPIKEPLFISRPKRGFGYKTSLFNVTTITMSYQKDTVLAYVRPLKAHLYHLS